MVYHPSNPFLFLGFLAIPIACLLILFFYHYTSIAPALRAGIIHNEKQ